MELYQLRTFIAVAEEGHLTRAAKRIHTSQSAVSGQIKALEEEFGVPLFTRSPKGMIVTEQGQTLLAKAQQALSAADGMLDTARTLRAELTGLARVGLNISAAHRLRTAEIMESLRTTHPGLTVHFINSMSHLIDADVTEGKLDGGFMYGEPSNELDGLEVDRTNMRVVAPVQWKDRVLGAPREDIIHMPWVWTPPECPFNQVAKALFGNEQPAPNAVTIADDEALLLEFAAAGSGLALMCEDEARAARDQGKIVLWEKSPGSVPLYFITSRRRSDDKLIRALRSSVQAVWHKTAVTA
ncbi:LysR family transcriptional regulator [Desulfovibrio ferrophilus]|uniref:Transcriptional regulator, LysR family n=1 Tax=Desulfovibrio ferrophilus TaxID=241368 RepID=A0A2Z6AXK8_9BACT|nr:LysR family transcriptional regulator [Desulfovibrio ferrophilus]BBD07933.1 transcriptional regulator, LysR family [Desulfovibrio ferrophilus]